MVLEVRRIFPFGKTTRRRSIRHHYTSKSNLYRDAYHLPIETAVYVPSTTKGQKRVSPKVMQRRVEEVRKNLSRKYGGYTSVSAVGGYVMKSGRLVKEPVVKVTAFAKKKDFTKYKPAMRKQLRKWNKKWNQESMGYEYEGDLYYVK